MPKKYNLKIVNNGSTSVVETDSVLRLKKLTKQHPFMALIIPLTLFGFLFCNLTRIPRIFS